jgi:hypothetical protein
MRTQATGARGVETYTESIVASRTSPRSTRECGADTLGLEENSLALACNRTGCEATGKQKLPAHVTSFASAEGGCRIVGVTDFRQAPEAMNILL